MRISDWSSDVCSSDLPDPRPRPQVLQEQPSAPQKDLRSRAGIGLAQAIRWSWPWIPQALAQPSWQLRACWTDGCPDAVRLPGLATDPTGAPEGLAGGRGGEIGNSWCGESGLTYG